MIIPYKDEAKYIKDCVSTIPESAEIEILLVADGGKEAVPQWVFEDQRISVILPEEGKGGVAACRNLGIQKARGEYVYFLDADDYVAEPALSALMEAAERKDFFLPDRWHTAGTAPSIIPLIGSSGKMKNWFRRKKKLIL